MNVKQLLLAKTSSMSGPHHYTSKTDGNHVHFYARHPANPADTDKGTLQGEAELLLSFANIARCEITDHPSALDVDESYHSNSRDDNDASSSGTLPMIPNLMESSSSDSSEAMLTVSPDLVPRLESISVSHFKPLPAPSRLRTVSFDTAHFVPMDECRSRTPSPTEQTATPIVSPGHVRRPMVRSIRQSLRARRKNAAKVSYNHDDMAEMEEETPVSEEDEEEVHHHATKAVNANEKVVAVTGGHAFQAKPRPEVPVTTIHRRKFSWKNYPELEQFLVANREEYLRHSALNYTIQQKQYNNRLTDRLLEIASEHGYMFSVKDFNFVTVRDRIRCFYKSFVQSAKKRGILMGYAARKAGLLSDDDLRMGDGVIIEPTI